MAEKILNELNITSISNSEYVFYFIGDQDNDTSFGLNVREKYPNLEIKIILVNRKSNRFKVEPDRIVIDLNEFIQLYENGKL